MAGTKKGNKGRGKKLNEHPATKKTRFGSPDRPPRDYHPMNMRAAMRHLASQEIDPRDSKSLDKLMGHHPFSIAETIAFKRLQMALWGDNHAIDRVEDGLCGKLADTHIIETPGKKTRGVKSATLEEAQARLDALLKSKD